MWQSNEGKFVQKEFYFGRKDGYKQIAEGDSVIYTPLIYIRFLNNEAP